MQDDFLLLGRRPRDCDAGCARSGAGTRTWPGTGVGRGGRWAPSAFAIRKLPEGGRCPGSRRLRRPARRSSGRSAPTRTSSRPSSVGGPAPEGPGTPAPAYPRARFAMNKGFPGARAGCDDEPPCPSADVESMKGGVFAARSRPRGTPSSSNRHTGRLRCAHFHSQQEFR